MREASSFPVLLFLLSTLLCSHALKIVVYNPKYGVSHVKTIGRMCDVLVEAGHEVTVLQPGMDTSMRINGSRLARIIPIPPSEDTTKWATLFKSESVKGIWSGNLIESVAAMAKYQFPMVEAQCKDTFAQTQLFDTLRAENFDFAMTEMVDPCGVAVLSALNQTRWALLMTTGMPETLDALAGLPQSTSWVPGCVFDFSDRMSFSERVWNFLGYVLFATAPYVMAAQQDDMMKRIGVDVPPFADYLGTNSLIIVNADPLVDFPRPTLHKIVSVGGISANRNNNDSAALDEEWNTLLAARNRTVLVSFGTMSLAYLMPHEYKDGLREMFLSLPDTTFIFKYERPDDGFCSDCPNVVLRDWLPQPLILADPRISLFITHAGMGSTYEGIRHQVPMVVIPIMGDQTRNGRLLLRHGVARMLKKQQLADAAALTATVAAAIDDPTLREAAARLAATLDDRPFTPEELLIRNVEFASKHGPLTQLDPYSRQLSTFVFYSLDVVSFLLLLSLVTTTLSIYSCVLCVRCCRWKCKKQRRYQPVW